MSKVSKATRRLRRAIWGRREEIAADIRRRGLTAKIMGAESYHIRITNPGTRGFIDYWPTTDSWGLNRTGVGGTAHNNGEGFESMIEAALSLSGRPSSIWDHEITSRVS